jgi:hypothetical protein
LSKGSEGTEEDIMQNGFLIITTLTLCNFLIFMALIAIIIRARHRQSGSSFKQLPAGKYLKITKAESAAPKDCCAATGCKDKCESHIADDSIGLHGEDQVMQKNELLPIE